MHRNSIDLRQHIADLRKKLSPFIKAPLAMFRPFNVCMWHSGRCGSKVLANLIMQDSRMVWGFEILEGYSKDIASASHPDSIWEGAKRRIRRTEQRAGVKNFGFEMKTWHLTRMNVKPATALQFLAKRNYAKHIVLERKNYVRAFVSNAVALKTHKFHLKAGESSQLSPVTIHPEICLGTLTEMDDFYSNIKLLLEEKHLFLSYEDHILPSPVSAYAIVMEYLGLEPQEVVVNLAKTTPFRLREIVINFDELENHLSGTKYAWMMFDEHS